MGVLYQPIVHANSTDLLGAQMLQQPAGLDLIENCLIGSSSAISVLEERDTPLSFCFPKEPDNHPGVAEAG